MSCSNRFRVAVIDRNRLFADCLGVVLELRQYDLRKVAPPAGGARTPQVLAEVLRSAPGLVLVSADLGPECDTTALIGALAGGGVAVIVITDDSDEEQWGHWLASGARIVIPRSASLAGMVSAIRRISRGERVLDVAERERLLAIHRQHGARRREHQARLCLLSTNESQILLHLMAGRTVREIAARRVVSEATVRTQVKAILSKLGVGSQLAAVAMAHAGGWDPATAMSAAS